ncbi:MAG: glycerophosphodiester phosphodiesterase family protein [Isosphaeraceae bacterium]
MISFGIALALGILLTQPPAPSRFVFFEPVAPPRRVQVVAHRGAASVAPENTAQALEAAIADGFEWAEVDVRLTSDGRHVLFHDATLDDKTDSTGPVDQKTLAELEKVDAGSKFARRFAGARILTLAEGLKLAKGRINLYLDCKTVNPALLAREVRQAGMERQVVIYDTPATLSQIRREAGDAIGLMTKWRPVFGIDGWLDEVQPHAVEIDAGDVSPEICRSFHEHGIKVQAKVLGSDDCPEVWDRMIAAGVDWLQTDRAEEILARLMRPTEAKPRVRVAFHRGASRYAPENTLPAFARAVRMRADFVEFDVRSTGDGQAVLIHDVSLLRTTSDRGAVRKATLDQITALDAGRWFGRPFVGEKLPTLDAFLEAVKPLNVSLYVDAKDVAPEVLVTALRKHGLIDRSVVYQGVDYLVKLRALAPELKRMPALRNADQLEDVANRVQPFAFDTAWPLLSKALIDRCHARGIQVFSDALGTHETIAHYQQAIRDGIDVIQTDHPLRVYRAIQLLNTENRP